MKKLSFLFAALIAGMIGLSAQAEFTAWVYDYGSNTPRAAQESWTEANLVDTTAGAANATFSGAYNNEKNCFDGKMNTRWIQQTKTPWVIYKFGAATKISAYGIRQATNNGYDSRVPISWELYGSNAETPPTTVDDASWEKLDTRTSVFHNYKGNNYDFGSRVMCLGQPANYRTYLLKVTGNKGEDYTVIGELEFYYMPVVVPVFGDCSFDYVKDGEYALSGVFTENAPTSLSLVLTPEGDGEAKTIVLDAPEVNVPFEKTVVAADEGLSTEVIYTAKLVAVNADGSSEKEFGRCYFGPMPRPTAYAQKIEFSVSDAIATTLGESTMTDFPVLVRLSSESVADYDPSAFVCEGRDLYFEDEDGSALSFELDTFDSAGETFVWVKIPFLSATTKFTCYYGGLENVLNEPTDVWSGYLGVWHYNTTEATVPNATANANLDATAASASTQLTGDATPFGSRAVQGGAAFQVPDYEPAYKVGNKFSVSGWFKMPSYEGVPQKWATWVSKKVGLSWNADTGWYLQMNQSKTKCGLVESSGTETLYDGLPDVTKNWIYFHYVNDGGSEKVYFNGSTTPRINKSNGTIKVSSTVFQMLAANQQGDEFRLSKSTWSALRTSLEYKSMKNADFLSNSGSSAMDASAPVFETPIVQVASDGSAAITFTVTDGEGNVYTLVDGVKTLVGAIGTDITLNEPKTVAIAIDADACVSVGVYGVNSKGTEVTKYADGGAMNAAVEAVVTNDANERGLVPGVFTISRPNGVATDLPIVVNLSWEGGTAVQGKNYTGELPVTVTIPAGEVSTTVVVTPLRDAESENDETIVITVAAGAYKSGATATMKILNLVTDPNYNTWIAAVDGKASDAANWSQGVPQAGQKILFDPQFSTASCEWGGGVNGLATTVAEWKQLEGYTGTITFDTTYTGAFNSLSVTGDVTLGGGTWTHLANTAAEEYRLKVVVGGNVTIAAAAKIDASGKGFASGKARPGSDKGCHASPMGSAGADKLYGDVKKPEALGSGSDKGAGGGAIYIEATGSFANEGQLNVNSFGGAAGSIYVKATSVSGAGTYSARAPESVGNNSYMAGSGGRIAFELTGSATITDDESAFVNGKCTTGFAFNGRNSAAGGTILVKSTTHENGVLYVDGQSGATLSYVRLQPEFKNMLAIPAGETWVLDGIVFLNKPIAALKVSDGTTLSLPGGLASVKAYGADGGIGGRGGSNAKGNRGLVVDGGTLVLPDVAEHLIANNWTLQANQALSLDGNVRVNAGGRIGVVSGYGTNYSYTNRCDLIVLGDLTIESNGSIDATGAGWKNYSDTLPAGWGWTVNVTCGAHGGVSKTHSSAIPYVYDSILNPMLPGEGAQNGDAATAQFGGGCVKLTVSGKLTLNGAAHAKSVYQDGNGGAGGTVNITCATIEGSGGINVTTQSGYGGTQGGGGRVAIRLTGDGADFADYPLSRITVTQNGDQSSGGTIYLQTAAEAENAGTVYIKGDAGNTAAALTPFPSLVGGGENDNFSAAKLQIVNNGKMILSADAKVGELRMENTGVLDFNGKVLKVRKAILKQSDGTAMQKLAEGTYTAAQLNELTGTSIYTDSVGGGSLVVKGSGLMLLVR